MSSTSGASVSTPKSVFESRTASVMAVATGILLVVAKIVLIDGSHSDLDAIRSTLAQDCVNLPRSFASADIRWLSPSDGMDWATVDGLKLMVEKDRSGPWSFGPLITDSSMVALHDSWGCGGIVHSVTG